MGRPTRFSRGASVLTNANNNNYIQNSSSIIPQAELSLDALYGSVARNAILNTGGRADEVRCYPGTREEVIGLIEGLVNGRGEDDPRMLWLSGPAGAGKTAIMQAVAERFQDLDVHHANFFFFRGDASRNHVTPLVPTLVYQILQLYPSAMQDVAKCLHLNPLSFRTDIKQQFETLMHLPFTTDQRPISTHQPVALLIDGLDECDSTDMVLQKHILQALDKLLIQHGDLFRIVVASRAEPRIVMAFNSLQSKVTSIFLDDQYSPKQDIRHFVTAEFKNIRRTHYHAHTLSADWPSAADIDYIVTKSSGQFIYAATVMRFIAHSIDSPELSLKKVQEIVPLTHSPFAHLDAIYAFILSQVDDQIALQIILASNFVVKDLVTIQTCLEVYHPQYSVAMMNSCIGPLAPIAEIRHGQLVYFHASFADFLQDKDRSGEFHIDLQAFCAAVFPKVWMAVPILDWIRINIRAFAISALERVQRPNPEITTALMDTDLSEFNDYELLSKAEDLIKGVYQLYAPRDLVLFTSIMQTWSSGNEALRKLILQHFPDATPQSIADA